MNELLWTAGFIVIFCILLYFGNRWKMEYDTDSTVNQEPTVIDLSGFRESMKVKSPLTEEDREWLNKMKDSAGTYASKSENIWKDMIEVGARLKELDDIDLKFCDPIPEHLQPFYPLETDVDNNLPRYYVGPIRTAPDWTEFKERNPELFHQEYQLTEKEAFHPTPPNECFVAGTILNGTLLVELQDSKVIQFFLEGNVPPNGDYMVEGELKGTRLIRVIKFQPTTRH